MPSRRCATRTWSPTPSGRPCRRGWTACASSSPSASSSGASGRWTHVVTVAGGEYVIAYGTRIHNWPGGQFRGFDVPAGTITRDSAFMFRVKDGRITDRWAIRDDLAMMAQLGAVQPTLP